ncbi:2-oxoglutarate (2OG) and Fe(II)-dependent oxygenase superfamily protein [Raphanus sativus]|nr:2-oxoglutarate (2OG) and Fe(II)-dependent oxygenase superfamily protein [Raphanus sativus]
MTISSNTQSHLTLPVIDFSIPNLKPETQEWESVRAQVRTALEEYGCFEALLNGASVELRKALFEASEEFFDLPLETKLRIKSDELYKGYAGQHPTLPLYEAIGCDAENPQTVDELTYKLWPQGNVTFQSFAVNLIALDVKVRTMIMESFGLEKYLVEEHLNSARKRFGLIKYRGLDENEEEQPGLNPHIDSHVLTILCQNDVVDGVEIRAKDGEEWIKLSHLKTLLSSVFPPYHRVVITGKKDRHVAGLFVLPKEGLMVNTLEEIVDDEHPRLYKPFNYDAYFKFNITNTSDTHKRDLSALKAYCSL